MGDHDVCPSCGGQSLDPALDGCATPTWSHAATWVIVGADDSGISIEWSGEDPEKMPDWMGAAAQQEEDRWPEMGLIYMLVEPTEAPLALAMAGES